MHVDSEGAYGKRRVTRQLRREGHQVNHKRVERLMRAEAIVGAYVPARRRRDVDGVLGVAGVRAWPDLVARDFSPAAPNQAWCADMKQIQTAEGRAASRVGAGPPQPCDRRLGDGRGRRLRARRERA